MPPNPLEETKPSETAMAAAKKVGHVSMEWTSNGTLLVNKETDDSVFIDEATIIDAAYAPLVKQGARVADVLDEVISALVDQDPDFAQCSFARESLDAFKSVLARATPKGDKDGNDD